MKPTLLLAIPGLIGLMYVPQARAQAAPAGAPPATSATCAAMMTADLKGLVEAPAQITSVRSLEATGPAPAACEVNGVIDPSIGFTIRLPESKWNGKLVQVGCGNWCGVRLNAYYAKNCDDALRRGYACIMSDAGHVARPEDVSMTDGQWAYNNLQAELDWGGRASHLTSLVGKALVKDFYNSAPARAYFMGCSYGGHQAAVLAERYPWDFDGIVGGGIPNNISSLMQQNLWAMRYAYDERLQPRFSEADIKTLHAGALAECDMDDGIKDGLISNPRACGFNPDKLTCRPGAIKDCVSKDIADRAKRMYSGPTNSSGEKLTPGGWAIGTELFWRRVYRSDGIGLVALAPNYFRYMGRNPDLGPNWSVASYDFDTDYRRNDVMETLYAADNPDLRRFKAAGGKFINYVGWSDMGTVPAKAIDYYETVERTMGGPAATQDFYRMFMIPGALHCRGGEGADNIDFLNYIENWVERGKAPDRMIGEHHDETGRTTFTRPTFPYPQMAKYSGSGDPNDAANFKPVLMK